MFIKEWTKIQSSNEEMRVESPVVIGTKNDSVSVDADDRSYLDISPYELSMLTGSNPLHIFGEDWKYAGTKNGDPIFINSFTYGNFTDRRPCAITVVLSRSHNFTPLSFHFEMLGQKIDYICSGFTQYRGAWLASDVTSTEDGYYSFTSRKWHLEKVEKSSEISIKMPMKVSGFKDNNTPIYLDSLNDTIVDYRLIDQDYGRLQSTYTKQLNDAHTQYQWTGKLPTLDELRKIKKSQTHLQFTSTQAFSTWMFIPGVLLIATGVFLKLRKTRKGKETATPTAKK